MDLPYISPAAAHLVDDPYSCWQRHVDAGRIATPAMSAEVRAQVAAAEAVVRGHARDARRLAGQVAERDRYYRALRELGLG